MSAIAGILHLNNQPVSQEHSRAVMNSLQKYPADDIQTWQKQNIFLGCHSQWITPESVGEKLPYYDQDRKLSITADAIIDNREELFELLQVSKSLRINMPDGKLILLAYEKWGENSPKYLIGDFAFMIWDEGKQKLFGARDFSGTRPLYYYYDSKKFTFSTTMESLFFLPYIRKHLNEEWLAEYLAITGTIDTVDARMTPYKDINQVPPSHSITISNNKKNITRYVSLYPTKKLKLKSDEEYVEAFQEVFQTAVNSRLRTTHKVGAQLSGGLDSGAVVGFANNVLSNRNQTLDTFSYIPHKGLQRFHPQTINTR